MTGPYKPSKKTRRRAIGSSLVFCATCVGHIVYTGGSDPVHIAALYVLAAFASSIIWFYINGSSKDTKSFNQTLAKIKDLGG